MKLTMKNDNLKALEAELNNNLEEIRTAIIELDLQRADKTISEEERAAIELSIRALRDSERSLIEATRKKVIKDLTSETEALKQLSAEIRTRVTKIGKTPKWLDKVETIIKITVKLLTAAVKW